MSLAFYTCYFGSDDSFSRAVPPVPSEKYDCYYFTNHYGIYVYLDSTRWKRVWMDKPIHNDDLKDTMESKEIRCCPERFPQLRGYDYLCWMDTKISLTSEEALEAMWCTLRASRTLCVAATAHPCGYENVWGEYELAIQHERYAREKDTYKAYIENQLSRGMDPSRPNRICAGFRLMKMNDRRKELGETWLSHIHQCGIEDQISWQFVHQLYEDAVVVFPHQYAWSYL